MSDFETELKAMLERARDEGITALTIYLPAGESPRYAGPHLSVKDFTTVMLAAIESYRVAMRPRAVN